MCGRYVVRKGGQFLLDYFGIERNRADEKFAGWEAKYNIAPTTFVPGIFQLEDVRLPAMFKWGLLPFWAPDEKAGFKTINARSEEIETKATYKEPIRKRRCLLPADGYFEWKGEKGNKQPYYFTRPGGEIFAFAGVWQSWRPKASDREPILTCSILTTVPNEFGKQFHERMPVVIQPEHYDYWLDPKVTEVAEIRELFAAVPDEYFIATEVDKAVGNVKNQGAELIEPKNSAPPPTNEPTLFDVSG